MAKSHRSVAQKVAVAHEAARILRSRAGWVQPEWEFVAEKLARLLNILAKLSLPVERQSDLIKRTQWAVIDLSIMRSGPVVRDAEEELATLQQVMRSLTKNWSALMSDRTGLRGPVRDRLRGLDMHLSAAGIIARAKWADNVEMVLRRDLWRVIAEIEPMIKILRAARKLKNPAEHLCASKIAQAWLDNTGQMPTLSNNSYPVNEDKDLQSYSPLKRGSTPFQNYMKEAVPRPGIGDGIVRDVVAAIKSEAADPGVGNTTANISVAEIPKG